MQISLADPKEKNSSINNCRNLFYLFQQMKCRNKKNCFQKRSATGRENLNRWMIFLFRESGFENMLKVIVLLTLFNKALAFIIVFLPDAKSRHMNWPTKRFSENNA